MLEPCEGHVTRPEEENRKWQERNSQLLTKVCFIPLRLVLKMLTLR